MKKIICILVSVAVLTFCHTSLAAPHKLRLEDASLARNLAAQGAKVIGDYGAFTVLEADDALLTGSATNHAEIVDDWNLIRLNSRLLDTRAPETKALRKSRGAFAGRRLHLVQFAGPVKPEWLAALQRTGVKIVSYIPENAYLIYGDSAALARMQTWAAASQFTQWEGEYTGDLKIHSQARTPALTGTGSPAEVRLFAIQLLVDTNSNPATLALIDGLKNAPARMDFTRGLYRNLVVALPANQLDAIAAQPDVVSIQPYVAPKKRDERQDQIIAGNIANHVPTGPGYLAWLASKGFTQAQFDASGFVVDVADSGVDNGTATPGHFGLYSLGNPALASRLAYEGIEGTANPGGTATGCDGHGALNSHIIADYDVFTGFQHQDSAGFSYGVGVCPFVKIGSSVIFDNSVPNDDFTNPDYNALASHAYARGARISNNSWGSDVAGEYTFEAQTYDALVRDAQADVPGNQEMTFAFAAGNVGPCMQGPGVTLGIDSPGSAKNVIAVGASENVRSLSIANGGNDRAGNDACSESDANANSADDVDCGSSRGPCADGRMKPDLVAPGIHITGGVPQVTPPPSPAGLGEAISCFDAEGVCALPQSGTLGNTNNFFPLGQQFYTESSGTSHSTPVVAGACALIRQFFINGNLNAPSPAMTKAFLINSARYMTGLGARDSLWSPSQGMGEVNLGTAFDGAARFLRDQVADDKFTGTGQRRVFAGQVVDSSKPFRVTVAWTDAPGSTSGAAYNNDLDLTVVIGGKTYLGNVFKGQYSATGGNADRRNNVENVFLPAGVSGNFSVTITAANINSDGVPNEEPALDQDFALVIYNGTAASVAAAYTPIAASYNGLFSESGGAELGRSGAISVTTTLSGAYTGKLQLGAKSYSFSGMLDASGTATNVIVRKDLSSLGLSLNASPIDNNLLTGVVTDPGNWTADLRAERAFPNSKTSSTMFAGRYTVIFPGTNSGAQFPTGDGYGTVTVSTSGKIKLAGSLADGTKLSQSSTLSVNGQWPLYASLYAGQGQLLGWLTFTNSGSENPGGDIDWIKNAIPGAKFYPNGFNFDFHALGSIYNPGAAPLIGFENGVVILTGGNLPNAITNNVTVAGTSATGANGLTLKLSSATGTFKGSFANPPGKPISFSGAFLQNQNFGSGYFLGTDQSGKVFFGPAN
ncbi:MAG TPA: S8 family serine peptidase [Verrucomicrobiae bacterium]|nr:S8 family serine peptidase [Verrucomicrobiae bacterium]